MIKPRERKFDNDWRLLRAENDDLRAELRAAVAALRPFSQANDWNPLERVDRNAARAFVAAYDAKHQEAKDV